MEVWGVFGFYPTDFGHAEELMGVFSTEEKAQRFIDKECDYDFFSYYTLENIVIDAKDKE